MEGHKLAKYATKGRETCAGHLKNLPKKQEVTREVNENGETPLPQYWIITIYSAILCMFTH